MSWNRKRRYQHRWEQYQKRCDLLVFGPDEWFRGRDYDAYWDARWKIKRHNLINRGISSRELSL